MFHLLLESILPGDLYFFSVAIEISTSNDWDQVLVA
jgi:hypothetical protein